MFPPALSSLAIRTVPDTSRLPAVLLRSAPRPCLAHMGWRVWRVWRYSIANIPTQEQQVSQELKLLKKDQGHSAVKRRERVFSSWVTHDSATVTPGCSTLGASCLGFAILITNPNPNSTLILDQPIPISIQIQTTEHNVHKHITST